MFSDVYWTRKLFILRIPFILPDILHHLVDNDKHLRFSRHLLLLIIDFAIILNIIIFDSYFYFYCCETFPIFQFYWHETFSISYVDQNIMFLFIVAAILSWKV